MVTQLAIVDDQSGMFGPMCDLRPVFDLRSGVMTQRQRIEKVLDMATQMLLAAPALETFVDQPAPQFNATPHHDDWLVVNGRWSTLVGAAAVRNLDEGMVVDEHGRFVAARLSANELGRCLRHGRFVAPQASPQERLDGPVLLENPWQLMDQLPALLAQDLATLTANEDRPLPAWVTVVGEHRVHLGREVTLGPQVVLDARGGAIGIGDHVTINTNAIIEGPCWIGEHSVVAARTHLRGNTVIGPVCKVGGEISHCIFQGYANKVHDGFLGHSLVGQWVNLGASTVGSNLKNTYGPVRVQLAMNQPPFDTDRTYFGAILGDFVRTAIGTRLVTGCCIGTAAMIALSGFAPKFVNRFAFITDQGEQPTDLSRFMPTAISMQARRGVDQSAILEKRFAELLAQSV